MAHTGFLLRSLLMENSGSQRFFDGLARQRKSRSLGEALTSFHIYFNGGIYYRGTETLLPGIYIIGRYILCISAWREIEILAFYGNRGSVAFSLRRKLSLFVLLLIDLLLSILKQIGLPWNERIPGRIRQAEYPFTRLHLWRQRSRDLWIHRKCSLGDIFKHCAWYLRCSNYNLTLLKRSLVGFFADSNFPRRSQYLCSQTCGGLSSGLSSISSSPATTSKRAWEKKGHARAQWSLIFGVQYLQSCQARLLDWKTIPIF